jgi:hypothetical protein
MGYAVHGEPSPYIWSGTDQYKIGKITRDHGPIEPIVDVQPGCAALIKTMIALDPSISFKPAKLTPPKPVEVPPAPKPDTTPPLNWWAELLSMLRTILSIFGKK